MSRWGGMTPAVRLWAKVDKSGECWEWTGAVDRKGYGRIHSFGDTRTHRLSWELHYGPIPDGLWVLHRCDNPPCVRPDHLFLGTVADNSADMYAKDRQARGPRLPHTKLTEADVREIRRLLAQEVPKKRLGRQFGVAGTTILAIARGSTWTWVQPEELPGGAR